MLDTTAMDSSGLDPREATLSACVYYDLLGGKISFGICGPYNPPPPLFTYSVLGPSPTPWSYPCTTATCDVPQACTPPVRAIDGY